MYCRTLGRASSSSRDWAWARVRLYALYEIKLHVWEKPRGAMAAWGGGGWKFLQLCSSFFWDGCPKESSWTRSLELNERLKQFSPQTAASPSPQPTLKRQQAVSFLRWGFWALYCGSAFSHGCWFSFQPGFSRSPFRKACGNYRAAPDKRAAEHPRECWLVPH